jgi:hypothetical protein
VATAFAASVTRRPLSAEPLTPVTEMAGLRWVNDEGYLLPESAQAGPRVMSGGLASGFTDTPLGALVAMSNIAARSAWEFGPDVFQPTIETQVTGPYASEMLSLDQDAYGNGIGQAAALQFGDVPRRVSCTWRRYPAAVALIGNDQDGKPARLKTSARAVLSSFPSGVTGSSTIGEILAGII